MLVRAYASCDLRTWHLLSQWLSVTETLGKKESPALINWLIVMTGYTLLVRARTPFSYGPQLGP